MSLPLKPYSEYRDTGVSWLGQVPHHWQTVPGLAVFCERQAKNEGMIEKTVLSLSYGRIVVKPPERLHGLVPESFETYQVVDVGDIVIRPTDLQNDWTSLRVGLARDRGIITSAYMCLRPIQGMTPEYGYLLLHTYDLKKVFYGLGSGLRQNLDFTDLKRLPMLLPPPGEQSQIAAFLAHFDRRINRLISAKRRMIELLNEQKQAIIHRAVTRGLDPNVSLKPSGVEWLGDVPEHWEPKPLKYVCLRIQNGTTPPTDEPLYYAEGSIPWYGPSSIGKEIEVRDPVRHLAEVALSAGKARLVRSPALLIIVIGATAGRAALMRSLGCTNQQITAYELDAAEVDAEFTLHQVRTAEAWLRLTASTATIPIVNATRLSRLPLALPPLGEQRTIVKALHAPIGRLENTLNRVYREINLLHEYHTALVTDVVTGKLDVRGVEVPDLGDDELTEELRCEEEYEIEETDMPREDEDADD